MLKWFQRVGRRGFLHMEAGFNAVFGPRLNPLYHLGALTFLFFWVVIASGIYLYIFFETSIEGAYDSVEYLTYEQWYLGGIMRSLHRYASDAMVLTMMLHLLREFTLDRYRGFRWFSWITGVPLIWLVFASGINGYWLVWDKLAQYVAVTTAEWIDWLPLFNEPMARNFLNEAAISSRFFSLLQFLHIGIPLFLLLLSWVHIKRISRPRVNPPRGLMVGTLASLVVLSLLAPAVSQGRANLDQVASVIQLDWFYLAVYPLFDIWSYGGVWILLGGITLLLALMPWLPRRRPEPVAVVDLDNCNGCGRCFADCPFGAVVMQPRTDSQPFAQEALVAADLCASCGICVGACPTASPFRRTSDLVPGVDLPQLTIREIREKTLAAAAKLSGDDRVIVYGCDFGADLGRLEERGVAVLALPCIAALPPSFLDFVITRKHVDGVFLTGCREGDCYYRLGIEWTQERIGGKRDPYLRKRVPRERIDMFWAGPDRSNQLAQKLDEFRGKLRELGPYTKPRSSHPEGDSRWNDKGVRNVTDRME